MGIRRMKINQGLPARCTMRSIRLLLPPEGYTILYGRKLFKPEWHILAIRD